MHDNPRDSLATRSHTAMRRLSRRVMAVLAGGAVVWILWAVLSPWLPGLGALATGALLLGLLAALHKSAQWAERRGWIYYQQRQGSWGAVGAAMTEVHAIYRPGMRHVKRLEEDMHVYREDDDEGAGDGEPGDGESPGSRGSLHPALRVPRQDHR